MDFLRSTQVFVDGGYLKPPRTVANLYELVSKDLSIY